MSESQQDVDGSVVSAQKIERDIERLRQGLAEAHERIDELEDTVAEREDRIDELEGRVGSVEDRTDLLQHIRRASSLAPEERAAVLIQTLHNQATTRGDRDNDESTSASMDVRAAITALGGGVQRSDVYYTFERAEEIVDNEDVLYYQKEPRSSDKNSRLVLNLERGELPDSVAGQSIGGDGV